MEMPALSYRQHRYPAEVIAHCVGCVNFQSTAGGRAPGLVCSDE